MVASLGGASAPGAIANEVLPGGAVAGLEAQLARYQKELSNCVNCASAKTPEGKEEIQRLSNEVDKLKARIEASGQATKIRSEGEETVSGRPEKGGRIAESPVLSINESSISPEARRYFVVGSAVDTFG